MKKDEEITDHTHWVPLFPNVSSVTIQREDTTTTRMKESKKELEEIESQGQK